jgi:hypothetical protein
MNIATLIGQVERAKIGYKRALTRHVNEQNKGKLDMSPVQTRKMYYAAMAVNRAAFKLRSAERSLGLYQACTAEVGAN